MAYDAHTPCPFCARVARDVYAVARRVAEALKDERRPEYEELALVLEAARPLYNAHHENQLHAFSPALEGVREPGEPTELSTQQLALLPLDARD